MIDAPSELFSFCVIYSLLVSRDRLLAGESQAGSRLLPHSSLGGLGTLPAFFFALQGGAPGMSVFMCLSGAAQSGGR